jgi:hypothetical protein
MKMECRDFEEQLDDWLDGQLDAARQASIREHLELCQGCRRRREHAFVVQSALRVLAPPALRAGFANQALSRATGRSGAVAYRRAAISAALAATLVLGVAVSAFFATRPAPVQTVALALDRPETVSLVFTVAKPLEGAMLNLALPENVELVGYGGRRELSWSTDLHEGGNLLRLPLIARGTSKDELVARVSHGASSKTFRLRIEVQGASRLGT